MAAPQSSSVAVAGSGSSAPNGSGLSFGNRACAGVLVPAGDGSTCVQSVGDGGMPGTGVMPGIGVKPGTCVKPGKGGKPGMGVKPGGVPPGGGPVVLPATK